MDKTELVARTLHAAGFNADLDVCRSITMQGLTAAAGGGPAFREWNTQVGQGFADAYIAANSRSKIDQVNWEPVFRELSGPCR